MTVVCLFCTIFRNSALSTVKGGIYKYLHIAAFWNHDCNDIAFKGATGISTTTSIGVK